MSKNYLNFLFRVQDETYVFGMDSEEHFILIVAIIYFPLIILVAKGLKKKEKLLCQENQLLQETGK